MKRCILHIALFVAAAVVLTACGSGKKSGVWTDGTFSLNYPPETYEVTGEDKDGELSCFTISCKEEPSNKIEFKVYRYEPDFVKTIRIDQIAGELKADVCEIRERLCGMLNVTDGSDLIFPEELGLPYEVNAFLKAEAPDGDELFVRITSSQIENYNVIAIALGDSPERMLDYAGILSSMRVEF